MEPAHAVSLITFLLKLPGEETGHKTESGAGGLLFTYFIYL